ncbi:MAG: DUF4145 domain-containing protein [Chloroflexota bacterium]|nr:DUF4145 domain-containing protein [Chloroflexota bacterium]
MFRRALESVCVDKGETTGRLVDRLKRLATSGVLLPDLADWATEVRQIGNAGAHIIPDTPVEMEDAHQLQGFTRELLRYLYELPAELKRRRSR